MHDGALRMNATNVRQSCFFLSSAEASISPPISPSLSPSARFVCTCLSRWPPSFPLHIVFLSAGHLSIQTSPFFFVCERAVHKNLDKLKQKSRRERAKEEKQPEQTCQHQTRQYLETSGSRLLPAHKLTEPKNRLINASLYYFSTGF